MPTQSNAFNIAAIILLGASLAFSSPASAQQPPYDVAPDVEVPYFRVRYVTSNRDGELDIPKKFAAWIPPGVKNLRSMSFISTDAVKVLANWA